MHTQTHLKEAHARLQTHTHTDRTPAESIDGHTSQTHTAQTYSFVPFLTICHPMLAAGR